MNNQELLSQFDSWFGPDGPVAITAIDPLEPVLGPDGVVFPPTFAPPQKSNEGPYYVIDDVGGSKVALLDSVGSQANRLEPLFKQEPYSALVPKGTVRIGNRVVDVLDAGHRAADAVVRFSTQREAFSCAFRSLAETGNAVPLAKLSPTSLLFGVWDSRGTQVKLPRLLGATIRAHDVQPLTRAAQFFSVFEKEDVEDLGENQDFLSEQGLSDAPAGRTLGGVLVKGGIRREAVFNLVALRALAGSDAAETLALRRYVLGLGLVAFTAPLELFLREGCLLVPSREEPASRKIVSRQGERTDFQLSTGEALQYAQAAAAAFGVGSAWEASFDKDAVAAVAGTSKKSNEGKSKRAKT
jgi:CRISPR-associated protein GSU0053/csb1, Dpsyc system